MLISEAMRIGIAKSGPLTGRHVAKGVTSGGVAADAGACAYFGLVGAWPDNNPLHIAKALFERPFAPIPAVVSPIRAGITMGNGYGILGIITAMNDGGFDREAIASWLEALGL